MEYPNKIFVSEQITEPNFLGTSHYVIVIAAVNHEVARKYVKDQIGIDVEPVWLMNAYYPTIYVSNGSVPSEVQAKILYNGNAHYKE